MFTLVQLRPCLLSLLLAASVGDVSADKADRTRPMTLESDQPCVVNLLKQTSVCSGNVSISQGTLQIRADRLELSETPEGYLVALATGAPGQPASYRQKRDGVDEMVEGRAQRIDYDSRAGTLRFEGAAVVRRLRGATVADEIQGAIILWDSSAESFRVQGGDVTAGNPGGRVRAVITPRAGLADGGAAPRPAAPAGDGGTLKPSTTLGDRR